MDWKDEYLLGIQEIDAQHRQLLSAFSTIENAIKDDEGWAATYYAVDALKEQARMHFLFEEAMMRLFGFAELEAHRQAHLSFFERLAAVEHHSLKETAQAPMVSFLRDWLTDHILGTDREYARYILAGAAVIRSS